MRPTSTATSSTTASASSAPRRAAPDANCYPADKQYDPLDRPVKSPDGRGNAWDTLYDPNGNPPTVGPETVYGASKLIPVSRTRRGDRDGALPAMLEFADV